MKEILHLMNFSREIIKAPINSTDGRAQVFEGRDNVEDGRTSNLQNIRTNSF